MRSVFISPFPLILPPWFLTSRSLRVSLLSFNFFSCSPFNPPFSSRRKAADEPVCRAPPWFRSNFQMVGYGHTAEGQFFESQRAKVCTRNPPLTDARLGWRSLMVSFLSLSFLSFASSVVLFLVTMVSLLSDEIAAWVSSTPRYESHLN